MPKIKKTVSRKVVLLKLDRKRHEYTMITSVWCFNRWSYARLGTVVPLTDITSIRELHKTGTLFQRFGIGRQKFIAAVFDLDRATAKLFSQPAAVRRPGGRCRTHVDNILYFAFYHVCFCEEICIRLITYRKISTENRLYGSANHRIYVKYSSRRGLLSLGESIK